MHIPDCTIRVVQGSTILADVCHIKAANPGGSRYDAKQSAAERHGYENLILVCPTHHRLIDDDTKTYTVEHLLNMKADHERDSSPLGTAEVEHAIRLLLDQSVRSVNQSGGITAHTVHQTINPTGARHRPTSERGSTSSGSGEAAHGSRRKDYARRWSGVGTRWRDADPPCDPNKRPHLRRPVRSVRAHFGRRTALSHQLRAPTTGNRELISRGSLPGRTQMDSKNRSARM